MVTSRSCKDICDYCVTTVLSTTQKWGLHHDSLEQFRHSMQSKCIFCTNISAAIDETGVHIDALSWPCYRWSIHSQARTRDIAEVLSVVFRPVHSEADSRNRDAEIDLPDKLFYLYRENDLGRIPKREALGPSTNCPQSWYQVHSWIGTCLTQHEKCQRKLPGLPPVPTRLLDISDVTADDSVSGRVRLVNTKASNIQARYTTLSHSWGPEPSFITTRAEDEEQMMKTGITLDDPRLSNNFRQAIQVSRHLGIDYMWMDSLCILQKNTEDFSKEAPRMHLYYRNSFCNIAAADSKRPVQGLFRDRNSADIGSISVPTRFDSRTQDSAFGCKTWLIVPADFWQSALLQEPLYKRGWVFQERMLAPRIVHFAQDQIFFECATISACETLPDKLPRAVDVRAAIDRHWRQRLQGSLALKSHQLCGTEDLSIESFWKTAISTYTRCELSDGGDKLVAVAGVATLVGEALEEMYGYGLWAANLEEQLAWRVVDCKQANGSASRRPWPSRCPTWSWASMDAVIDIQDRLAPHREYRVTDHYRNRIHFVVEQKIDKISVPNVLLNGRKEGTTKSVPQTSVESGASSVETASPLMSKGVSVKKMHPSCIEIQASVDKGQIAFDHVHSRWLLKVPYSTSGADQVEEFSIEVYPDELPATDRFGCTYMILSYSRVKNTPLNDSLIMENHDEFFQNNTAASEHGIVPRIRHWSSYSGTGPPPTFKGLGLIIHEVIDDHFFRLGSFQFNDLYEEQLRVLIPIASNSPSPQSVRNIYLH